MGLRDRRFWRYESRLDCDWFVEGKLPFRALEEVRCGIGNFFFNLKLHAQSV